ncbi:hypothetical protein SAMN05216357_11939 [Porphyromonadaceae bacterium KH3CP3RA]|nr:hypothetical protein SAMN05216357_11939 [Porphyromonadaceae bacterium KH3CP3RA]
MLLRQTERKEFSMKAIEIKTKEQELIREINSDVNLLESALEYVRKIKKSQLKYPCQYSVDELKIRLKEGHKAAKAGIYKTQSEMRSKHPL